MASLSYVIKISDNQILAQSMYQKLIDRPGRIYMVSDRNGLEIISTDLCVPYPRLSGALANSPLNL